jgi:RNA polymerase sigma-70 factor (ECF subfamily)
MDENDFTKIVSDGVPPARRVIGSILGQGALNDADDVLQEGLCKAWIKRGTLKKRSKSIGWFLKIVKRTAIDWLRSRIRSRRKLNNLSQESQAFWNDLLCADPTNDPRATMILSEDRARIMSAVGSLPPENRTVFILAYIDNLSETEIKERLDISIAMVRKRKFMARQDLQKKLIKHFQREKNAPIQPLNEI